MKLSAWAWAWALSSCLLTGSSSAQGLRQPFSVRPTGFDYNRYLQDESPSPSDQPAPAAIEPEAAASAPVVGSGASDCGAAAADCCAADGGCDNGCSSCGSCSSCGCGLGSCLGNWCCLGEAHTISSHLFCEDSQWSVGGWSQLGYTDHSDLLFNTHPGRFNLHQQWVWLQRTPEATACTWDWGFRADALYGTDAQDTQAFGNTLGANGLPQGWDTGWDHGIYGFAMPQLYGEIARGDLTLKAGYFYTIIGYESVMATKNFFYSHAFTQYNNEPFQHTGALATYKLSDNLEIYGGWTLGWDSAFDQFGDASAYLGGFSAQLTDNAKLIYASTLGDFGWRGSDGYMNSVILDTTLTDKLNYVFQLDYLIVDSTEEDDFALVNYLFYTLTDCVKLGGRFEWWKNDPLLTTPSGNVSVYESTFGVNIRPHANFVVRPEIRQQWAPAADYDETIFGVDAVATF